MDESLKVFAKQLGKNAEKQPGWTYLLAAIYLVLYAFGVPSQLDIAGWRLTVPKLSAEIWATLLALFLYQIGDALDKVTFKKRDKDGKWTDRFQPETFKDASTGSISIGRWWHCQPKIRRRSPAKSLVPYACSSGRGLS